MARTRLRPRPYHPRLLGLLAVPAAFCLAIGLAAPAVASEGSRGLEAAAKPKTNVPSPLAAKAASARTADLAASAQAHASGKPVVVASLTTETSITTARPNGTFMNITNVMPVRVKVNGHWRPISTTLRHIATGYWTPRAVPSSVAFSGGGLGPMVSLTSVAGARLNLEFPGRLPAPAISGSSALYRSVLPGTDLDLTATRDGGVSAVVIIHNSRAAANPALRSLRLALRESGLRAVINSAGVTTFTNPAGVAEFTAPPAAIWDSRYARPGRFGPGRSSVSGPGAGAHQALVPVRVAASSLLLTPPRALLAPQVTYPVFVGYSITAPSLIITAQSLTARSTNAAAVTPAGTFNDTVKSDRSSYTEIKDDCPNTSFWDDSDQYGQGVGYQDYSGDCGGGYSLYRALYSFNVENLDSGMHVQSGTLQADVNYGADWTCGDKWPITVHWLNAISSSTTWNNVSIHSGDAPKTDQVKPGPNPGNSSCTTQTPTWDVTGAVSNAAGAGTNYISFGLWGDETKSSTNYGFMRVGDNPSIDTVYDRTPNVPTFPPCTSSTNCNITPSPQDNPSGSAWDAGCGSTTGWINTVNPVIQVNISPAISYEDVRANYSMTDSENGGATVLTGVGSPPSNYSNYYSNGGETTSYVSPVSDGHSYSWKARANVDGNGNDTGSNNYSSGWTSTCKFDVDLTAPQGLAVASANFPPSGSGQSGLYAGQQGTFSFSAHDFVPSGCNPSPCLASNVARFLYSLNTPIPTVGASYVSASANSNGSTASGSLTLTPTAWGTNILYVEAEDNAGNISQPSVYTFYAPWNPTTKVAPGDVNGDGIPDLLGTTSTDLELFPGNADPQATPVTASPEADSPDGTGWNTFQITHRGSMIQQTVDDLFAHKGSNLYVYLNNPLQPGIAPQYNSTSNLTTIATHPSCTSRNCTGYTSGNWSDVTQILAPGDLWAGSSSDNGLASLLTVENGELWAYQGQFGNAIADPVLLGSSSGSVNWSGVTLIAPGTVGGTPTIWVRSNSTGTLYSYAVTIASDGDPTLNPSSPGTPVAATSGTVVSGVTLSSSTYPAVASPGPLDNSSYPGLYAEQTTGTSPSGASCANGCLWYYPGQSTSGGASPLSSTPVFVGILSKAISQLS